MNELDQTVVIDGIETTISIDMELSDKHVGVTFYGFDEPLMMTSAEAHDLGLTLLNAADRASHCVVIPADGVA